LRQPGSSFRRVILEIVIDELRAAAEALNRGDPEPLASLFAGDAEWRGVSHGHLWWKRTPS
jgi:ketosteroid isomerase-like protein